MASRPLPSWSTEPRSVPAPPTLYAVATVAEFSDLEWSIVAMAEHDGLASLRRPNRFWRLISAIFGIRPANPLANDRLEALRRVAVLAWRGRAEIPQVELQAFFEAGYSAAHFDRLQRRIAAVGTPLARRSPR